MKNIVEWLIQFKANANNVPAVARRVEGALDRVGRKADRVSSKIGEAFSGRNFKQALGNIPVIGSLMNPYVAAVTAIGAGLTAITRVGSEMEMTAISFKTLVGDAKKAGEMLKELRGFAKFTPYKTMDLVNSSKMMLSFGVSTDKAIDKLKELGDIAQGDANILRSLSLVYGQVSSLGYMQGQDWHQFINAGFNPLEELSEMTGKSMPELQEMMSKGQIGVRAIDAAIEHATSEGGKFYNMMQQQAESVQGRWSTLMGTLEDHLIDLFEYVKPVINWLIDVVPPIFDYIKRYIEGGINYFKQFAEKFPETMELLKTVWNWLSREIKLFFDTDLKNILKGLFNALGTIGSWIAKVFGIEVPKLSGGSNSTISSAKENQKKTEETKKPKKKYGLDIFDKPKGNGGKGTNGKDANAIATGGTRNTTINMTIGKFFDTMQVTMMDATDTTELETIVVQSLNRALAIATSTDR